MSSTANPHARSASASASTASRASGQRWRDGITLVLVLAAIWQLGTWGFGADVLPSPLATMKQVLVECREPDFLANVAATGTAAGVALLISVVGGVACGLVLGARRLAGDVAEPMLFAVYSVPKIALYPVVLLMFGLGMSAKIAFGAIHGIIPIVIFTMGAVRNLPPVYLRAAKVSRLTPIEVARHVLIPAAVPEIVAGLRIGFSLTLLGTLLGEMFASQEGIGHRLMLAIDRNEAPVIMAIAFMLFVFATAVSLLLLRWDNHLRRGAAP
jgi:NitT/TauT family transport system permease protein